MPAWSLTLQVQIHRIFLVSNHNDVTGIESFNSFGKSKTTAEGQLGDDRSDS